MSGQRLRASAQSRWESLPTWVGTCARGVRAPGASRAETVISWVMSGDVSTGDLTRPVSLPFLERGQACLRHDPVLVGLDPGHADRPDDLAVVDDREAALDGDDAGSLQHAHPRAALGQRVLERL